MLTGNAFEWARRGLFIFAAAFAVTWLAAFAINLTAEAADSAGGRLESLSRELRAPPPPAARWRLDVRDPEAVRPLRLTFARTAIRVSPSRLSSIHELDLAGLSKEVYLRLQRRLGNPDSLRANYAYADSVFGRVVLNGMLVLPKEVTFETRTGSPTATGDSTTWRLRLRRDTAIDLRPEQPRSSLAGTLMYYWPGAPREPDHPSGISVEADGLLLVSDDAYPVAQTARKLDFAPVPELLAIELFAREPRRPGGSDEERVPLLLRPERTYVPVFSQLVTGLRLALPFFIILLFLRSRAVVAVEGGRRLVQVAGIAAAGFAITAVLRGAGDLTYWLADRYAEGGPDGMRASLVDAHKSVPAAVLVLLLPACFGGMLRRQSMPVRRPVLWAAVMVSAGVLLLVLGASGAWDYGLAAIAAYALGCAWLALEVLRDRRTVAYGLLLAAAVVVVNFADTATWNVPAAKAAVRMLLALPVVVAVLTASGSIVGGWRSSRLFPAGWVHPWVTAAGLALLVTACLVYPSHPNETLSSVLTGVYVDASGFLRLAAIAGFMALLAGITLPPGTDNGLAPQWKDFAVGMAVFAFVPLWGSWLTSILTVAAAVLLGRAWLFSRVSEASLPLDSGMIDTLLADREVFHGLTKMKQKLLQKLTSGDMPHEEFLQRSADIQAELERRGWRPGQNPSVTVDQLFAHGISLPPSDRTRIAVRAGLLLAVPWLLLLVRDLASPESLRAVEQPLGLLLPIVTAWAEWALVTLFIASYFPFIRGDNGLEKGFSVFACLALPVVFATLALDPAVPAGSVVLWCLQMFVHAVVSGVYVGEYTLLRQAGLGWREMGRLHNWRSLFAWASSVVVAFGAAISTALVAGATSLLSTALRAAFPEISGGP